MVVGRPTGEIPEELGQLENLTVLNLAVNALSGSIPKAIGKLVHLTELVLEGNGLSGGCSASYGRSDLRERSSDDPFDWWVWFQERFLASSEISSK